MCPVIAKFRKILLQQRCCRTIVSWHWAQILFCLLMPQIGEINGPTLTRHQTDIRIRCCSSGDFMLYVLGSATFLRGCFFSFVWIQNLNNGTAGNRKWRKTGSWIVKEHLSFSVLAGMIVISSLQASWRDYRGCCWSFCATGKNVWQYHAVYFTRHPCNKSRSG